jgi:ApbE superfamily uncharacterized protein (UPF0280 family)
MIFGIIFCTVKGLNVSHYRTRTYRKGVLAGDLTSFHIAVKETDLWISAGKNLKREARDLVFDCRHQLETYIRLHPSFATTLSAWPEDPYAPLLVKAMIRATKKIGVGPMASVAGAIAQYVCEGLLSLSSQVIVENGGDICLKLNRPVTVSIFAGTSPLSERFGLSIPVKKMPLGICSSSATVGHSLSMGVADVVCILSSSASMADGVATALGNQIKGKGDMEKAIDRIQGLKKILGGVVIVKDKMASWGDIELVRL